jgi:uncharacterized protein (DUF305 family)
MNKLFLVFIGCLALAGLPGQAFSQSPNPTIPMPPGGWPGRYPVTRADAEFISGMISHHAQAVIMAKWAPTHGASKRVSTLCARIINSQTDEITLMQNWLKDRNLPVPEAKPVPMKMTMNGVEHEMMMPGMLTDVQMKELEQAQGPEFDRLFLTYMIQHHKGALTMVNQLLASPGAAQDDVAYKFSSDVFSDQTAEIERMQQMLSTLPPR